MSQRMVPAWSPLIGPSSARKFAADGPDATAAKNRREPREDDENEDEEDEEEDDEEREGAGRFAKAASARLTSVKQ